MLRALLFDLDDTLIDRRAAYRQACQAVCREVIGEAVSPAQRPSLLQFLLQNDVLALPGPFPKRLLPPHVSQGKLVRLLREQLVAAVVPQEGIVTLLASWRHTYRLVLVSNGSLRHQRAKLERAWLHRRFDAIVISGACGFRKPAPGIFAKALALAGCLPHEAMMIGDDPCVDIAGAAAAGIRTCWISRGRQWASVASGMAEPGLIVQHVFDLLGVLPCLTRGH